MQRDHVLVGLTCAECGRYDPRGKGWKALHRVDEVGAPKAVYVFCVECWERKFRDSEAEGD